ncbi:OmpH family outer membrane protein [Henriciella marina]|uniref:OmpH family outer membrane protein n=1 Tax=Henriciella marina TaxID=453851 RepID=UPI00037A3964|nr:OmpH family outer membrane protein [Henriciella marina]
MKLFNTALASVAVLFSTAIVAAPVAAAQNSEVVVIDQQRIMTETSGGQDIVRKVGEIGTTIQSELTPEANALQQQGEALEARTANMSMEAIGADEALRAEVEAYAQRAQQFSRNRQIAAAELQATERAAWARFYQGLQPVLEEVITETGANVMLDASQAVWSSESVDVTQSVIMKMNAAMPTVEVTRQTLTAEQRQRLIQQQQQQQQQR